MNPTASACPSSDREKQPRRSLARESAPHCTTIAPGRNTSMALVITGRKMRMKVASSIPSRSGTFTL